MCEKCAELVCRENIAKDYIKYPKTDSKYYYVCPYGCRATSKKYSIKLSLNHSLKPS